MNELAPALTDSGKAFLIKALNGQGIEFTRIAIGNGERDVSINRESLGNQIININIEEFSRSDNYVELSGTYDNGSLDKGFYMNEIGIFAQNDTDGEILYAYSYSKENVDYVPDKNSGRIIESKLSVIIAVGTADKVTAIITESAAYASKEELKQHISDMKNPHRVTAESVGLGRVRNTILDDDSIMFEESEQLENIDTTEKMKTIFGKIKKLFSSFISHVKEKNPHQISVDTINNTDGVLDITRGGTGANTVIEARKKIGVNAIFQSKSYTSVSIVFTEAAENASVTIPLEDINGYSAVAVAYWQIIDDGTEGADEHLVDLNKISLGSSNIVCDLVNRKDSGNQCKISIEVLYIKDL